jgi:hypothetical protein
MPVHGNRVVLLCGLIPAIFALGSCSSGPEAPAKGTPAFSWQAAKETYRTGDFLKTQEHLDKLTMDENEYSTKALAWSLMLTSGMAKGYAELADHYEIGGRTNKSDPGSFRKQVSNCRNFAGRLALQVADKWEKVQKIKGDTVPMAFPYPPGSAAPVAILSKVTNGIVITPDEMETAQKRALERGVMLAACRMAGAPDDTAKLQELLKAPEPKVARSAFVLGMASMLYEESQWFTSTKLDQPDKLKVFCERAQDALKGAPDNKESKELATKIQNALKPAKKKK